MNRRWLLALMLGVMLLAVSGGGASALAQSADACPGGWPATQDVVFSGDRDTGVANRQGADGCTIMDAIFAGAPFATRSAFLASVVAATRRFVSARLLDSWESLRIVFTAWSAPTTTPPGRTGSASSCPAGRVALTFDDGPSAYRPDTLAILGAQDVPATFFDVGERVDANPALTRYEAAAGHVVGYHTYRHEALTALSDNAIRQTLVENDQALRRAGVSDAEPILRPPYGAVDDRVQRDVGVLGGTIVLWTGIDRWLLWPGAILDYEPWRTAGEITAAALYSLAPDAILLLHDGPIDSPAGAATVAALPGIIDGARARGYCFGTVDRRGDVVAAQLKAVADPVPPIRNPVPYNPLLYAGTPPVPYVLVPAAPASATPGE